MKLGEIKDKNHYFWIISELLDIVLVLPALMICGRVVFFQGRRPGSFWSSANSAWIWCSNTHFSSMNWSPLRIYWMCQGVYVTSQQFVYLFRQDIHYWMHPEDITHLFVLKSLNSHKSSRYSSNTSDATLKIEDFMGELSARDLYSMTKFRAIFSRVLEPWIVRAKSACRPFNALSDSKYFRSEEGSILLRRFSINVFTLN